MSKKVFKVVFICTGVAFTLFGIWAIWYGVSVGKTRDWINGIAIIANGGFQIGMAHIIGD